MRVIDTHHHLWDPGVVAYELLQPDGRLAEVARRFDAAAFGAVAREHGIDAAVLVEATSAGADAAAETGWLLDEAARSDVITGVVAWAPLEDPAIGTYLDELLIRGRRAGVTIVGVRRTFESAPDGFVSRDALAIGVRAAAERGMVVDLVLFGERLAEVVQLVRRVPEASFVLDHLGKPRSEPSAIRRWRGDIARLALLPNVVAKVSGLATLPGRGDWEAQVEPLVAHAAATFGWQRLMFGSDWPICDLAGGYGRWLQFMRRMTRAATTDEQTAFFAGTAQRIYRRV